MMQRDNINKNIKFMIFSDKNTLENYLVEQIVDEINIEGGINLAIESRLEFLDIYNKLKEKQQKNHVSFRYSHFFMTDEFIFDRYDWKRFEHYSSSSYLDKNFFNEVDFKKENIHKLVNEKNITSLFSNDFAVYDSKIDAKNGLDILVIQVHSDGSLLFNQEIDHTNLNSKGIKISNNLAASLSCEFDEDKRIPKLGATLGVDQIVKAKKIFLIACGIEKNELINRLFFTKDYDKLTPLCFIKTHPNLMVLSDVDGSDTVMNTLSIGFDEHKLVNINVQHIVDNSETIEETDQELMGYETEINQPEQVQFNHDVIDQVVTTTTSEQYLENEPNDSFDETLLDDNFNEELQTEQIDEQSYENYNEDQAYYDDQQYPNVYVDENGNYVDEYGNLFDTEYLKQLGYDIPENMQNSEMQLFQDELGNYYTMDEFGNYIPYQEN